MANELTSNEPALLPTAQIARHPIHPMLIPIPIVCFTGALVSDIAYALSGFGHFIGAEFNRQTIGRGSHHLGVALQHLVGQPPDRSGNET